MTSLLWVIGLLIAATFVWPWLQKQIAAFKATQAGTATTPTTTAELTAVEAMKQRLIHWLALRTYSKVKGNAEAVASMEKIRDLITQFDDVDIPPTK